jgi:outer membrane protein assembly factor BamB
MYSLSRSAAWVTMLLLAMSVAPSHAVSIFQQLGGTSSHQNVCDADYKASDWHTRWVFTPLEGTTFNRAQQPCFSADGNTMYVNADSTTENTSYICAYDMTTGLRLWSCQVDCNVGYWSWSSVVYDNGYVYWAGGDGTTQPKAYKINAVTGSTLDGGWEVSLGASYDTIVNSTPTIADGRFYISTYGGFDPSAASHYALNLSDGSISWSNNDGGQGQGAMSYDSDRNIVYQTVYDSDDSDQELRAYDADTGAVLWTTDIGFGTGTYGAPFQCAIAYAKDTIYFQDYNFYGDGNLWALDATNQGSVLWTQSTPVSGDSSPSVDPDGNVYAYGDYNDPGQTRGYDSEGNILWTFSQAGGWQGSPVWCNDVVYAGQQVYGGYAAGTLYLLDDATGTVLRSDLTGSGPVSFGNASMVSVGGDGNLYAYDVPEPGSVALFGLGLVGLILVRRQRARSRRDD